MRIRFYPCTFDKHQPVINVCLRYGLKPEHLEVLRARLDSRIQLVFGNEPCADCEILVHGFPTREEILSSPSLHTLIVPWAGPPLDTLELMTEFPRIAVHSLHYNAGPTAEMALALLLAAAKLIVPVDRRFRRHLWTPPRTSAVNAVLLEGKSALILGYGQVGKRVAKACRGIGMHAIAIRRHPLPEPPDEIHGIEELPELLPRAAAVIVCLPHTRATTDLIGERELALLPPQAVLVNVARGPVVNEGALYRALEDRRLFAAGIDVWYRYPAASAREADTPSPPANLPFHKLDNAVLSPHRAGWSEETEAHRSLALAEALNAAARGESIPNRVDPDDFAPSN